MSKLYFMVGIVASGKSTWAETNKEVLNAVVHSSDKIREELGDVNDQSKNEMVFNILHKRVKEDLLAGKNVILDATNLNRHRRIHFISNELKNVPCEKICVLFATPIEICKRNNANRERKVPEEVIERMYLNFEVPAYAEHWDSIQIIWWNYKEENMIFDFNEDIKKWQCISHNNPHHTQTIGNHMISAHRFICDKTDNSLLQIAAIMHDCGKIYTKKFIDSKGNPCETAHYYQHHCCGSYDSLFYLRELSHKWGELIDDNDILYVSLLINLHMNYHIAYSQSDKAKEKDRKLFGDDIMECLKLLFEADKAAH